MAKRPKAQSARGVFNHYRVMAKELILVPKAPYYSGALKSDG